MKKLVKIFGKTMTYSHLKYTKNIKMEELE